MTKETELREKLATCTRILGMQQLVGLFGHVPGVHVCEYLGLAAVYFALAVTHPGTGRTDKSQFFFQ